ncbi:MAG: nucleotidyltransferase domain-containing protein [Nitrospira sp.]|nr:nucleotidyltransferase domain-containing protein [Nitrospira sp.]
MNTQEAVWLYGSVSRGDAHTSSDVDILVVGGGDLPSEVSERYCDRRLSLSRYSWDELISMASYGSLFLHHMKVEARPLFESPGAEGRLRNLLTNLPRYQRARRDLRAFGQSLLDISAELPDPSDLRFELATLAALIRRIGILGSYLLGRPRFDRIGPVAEVVDAWGLPSCLSQEFSELYQHRLLADGAEGIKATPHASLLALWIGRTSLMLSALEIQINAERPL